MRGRPAFDRDGQYLYFTASTNYGPTSSGLDMTSDEHEVTRNMYYDRAAEQCRLAADAGER